VRNYLKRKKTALELDWNEECDDWLQNFQFVAVVGGVSDLSYLLVSYSNGTNNSFCDVFEMRLDVSWCAFLIEV